MLFHVHIQHVVHILPFYFDIIILSNEIHAEKQEFNDFITYDFIQYIAN